MQKECGGHTNDELITEPLIPGNRGCLTLRTYITGSQLWINKSENQREMESGTCQQVYACFGEMNP